VWVICPPAAEQLASETWLELVQGLPFFDGDQAAVQARALTIAYQRARERPRRRVLRRRRAEPGSGRPDALAAVGGLPRPWAEVLLLRVLGGMSVEEVAVVTDRSVRSVRILQHLALRSLARRATRDGGPA
jgi:RNA polymerase sigma-70 factor (ECF subfamily)